MVIIPVLSIPTVAYPEIYTNSVDIYVSGEYCPSYCIKSWISLFFCSSALPWRLCGNHTQVHFYTTHFIHG